MRIESINYLLHSLLPPVSHVEVLEFGMAVGGRFSTFFQNQLQKTPPAVGMAGM
jgi:hypothetical protein